VRFCCWCKKPMHSSNGSVWVLNKNYSAHVKCIEKKKKLVLFEKQRRFKHDSVKPCVKYDRDGLKELGLSSAKGESFEKEKKAVE